MQNGTLLAAVDLGSNSFRLEIGRFEHGHIQRVEYLKETVRQGNGLDENRNLTQEAMERGWACLARFAERLAGFPREHVRAVATQTLREARNREEFLTRGSALLGYPIDVVSGVEEARLIYQGVAHMLPQSDERRLVVDIGGRSTEFILGQQFSANAVASYRVGSVAWSSRYFPDGAFTPQAFLAAEIAAKAVLDEALSVFQRDAWEVAYGSSGTAGAVGDILTAMGGPKGLITRAGLNALHDKLLRAQSADRVRMEGLKEDRRAVIGGGISVLRAVFDLLEIEEMHVAQGALRQGALYDLLDREQPETDLRTATVNALMQRFAVDTAHAERVAATACALFGLKCVVYMGATDVERQQQAELKALHDQGLLNEQQYQDGLVFIAEIAAEKRRALAEREAQTLRSLQMSTVSMAAQTADELYSVLERAGKERTALGKALFLASKGIAMGNVRRATFHAGRGVSGLAPGRGGPDY